MKIKYKVGEEFTNNQGKVFKLIKEYKSDKTYRKKFLIKFESGFKTIVSLRAISTGKVSDNLSISYLGVGILGYYKELNVTKKERRLWDSMIARCYYPKHQSYKFYGAKGKFVCERWHRLDFFVKDIREMTKDIPNNYELDKDLLGGNFYSKETCRFIPRNLNKVTTSRNKLFYAKDPKGNIYESTIVKYFAIEHDLDDSSIHKCLKGIRRSHKGFRFSYKLSDLQ